MRHQHTRTESRIRRPQQPVELVHHRAALELRRALGVL
jgi:hypothetical protein